MEAALAFVPEEEREKYSALTANSLFYFERKKSPNRSWHRRGAGSPKGDLCAEAAAERGRAHDRLHRKDAHSGGSSPRSTASKGRDIFPDDNGHREIDEELLIAASS